MILRDAVRDVLQQHRLARARRRDDEAALALADGHHQIQYPRGQVLALGFERELRLRIERGEILEEDLLARAFRRLEVDGLDLDEREVPLAVLRRPDLAQHGVSRVKIEFPDLRRRDVDVVGAGQVVVVGRPEEAEAVGQRLEHALRKDQAALFGARLEDLEDELLFAHAGCARHLELLGDLRERPDAHVLERRQLDALYFLGWRGAVALGRLRLRRGCLLRLLARLSIRFHSASSPSPVTAEKGSTEPSNTDSSSLKARIRSPRASLSIFVATTAEVSTVRRIQRHAARSFSSPGCRASTRSNALI